MRKKKYAARTVLVLALVMSASFPISAAAYTEAELRSVQTRDEATVHELREQEIRQIRIALGRRLPQNRQAELYFRLAEVYLEAYRQNFLLEGRFHERQQRGSKRSGFMDRSRSKAQLELGLKACREILAFKIPFAKLDQVYYFLGFNYNELGRAADARKAFSEIVRRFPRSAYASEAYRELGEIAYNQRKYREAVGYLEKALRGVAEPLKPRLEHRLAWSYYRTKQFGRAISLMKQAIAHTSEGGEKFLGLKDEALRDMAVFMTEAGRVEEAISYFDSVAGDSQYYARALEVLGGNYERNAEPQMAMQVYEALLKTKPDSEEAFRVTVKLVDLDLRRGNKRAALTRVLRSSWGAVPYLGGGGNPESAMQASNLKAMIRRTATESHQAYRKKSDRGQLEIAELAYETYLKKFLSDDPRGERIEIQMYLAEVKRDLGKSKDASALYRQVVQSRDVRYAKEAGSLWTASLAEAIQKSPARTRADSPSDLELEYVEASNQLQSSLPGSAPAREARLRATQVLAGYPGSREMAVERLAEQMREGQANSQTITAARLWLQLLQDHPDLGRLDKLHSELLANADLMRVDQREGGRLRALIADQATRAQIASIAQAEKAQDFESAASRYESFAAGAATRAIAEKALGSAVATYLKAGQDKEVERVLQSWLKRYPKSVLACDAIRTRATQALIQGEMEVAAQGFAMVGEAIGEADSFETAGRILEGLGQDARAEVEYVRALQVGKSSPGRFRVARGLALLQEKGGKFSQASAAYRSCGQVGSPLRVECLARAGDLYARLKDSVAAQRLWKEASTQKNSPWVGYARYQIAVQGERSAESFPALQFPEAQLKKAIDARVQYLETLNRSYQGVVSSGGPWAVVALSRIAVWVAEFADGLDRVEPTSAMSPEAVGNMRKGLAGISQGLRKRAAETALSAMSRAEAAQALSPGLGELGDLAARLRARVRAQGPYPALRLAGLAADGGQEGATRAIERVRAQLVKNPRAAQAWVDYGNLLWGSGKPGLGQIAYDRALALAPNDSNAWNNRGVVLFASAAPEDWSAGPESLEYWNRALKFDDLALAAKWNKASLLNYYRLFVAARPLWEQVLARGSSVQAVEGLAIAQQGSGQRDAARSTRARAQEKGAGASKFVRLYHDAAEAAFAAGKCTPEVRDLLGDIDQAETRGLEKLALERFRKECG